MNKEICIPLPDERENLFRHLHSTIPRLKPIRDCVSGKLGTIGGLGFRSKHSVSEAERLGLDLSHKVASARHCFCNATLYGSLLCHGSV